MILRITFAQRPKRALILLHKIQHRAFKAHDIRDKIEERHSQPNLKKISFSYCFIGMKHLRRIERIVRIEQHLRRHKRAFPLRPVLFQP